MAYGMLYWQTLHLAHGPRSVIVKLLQLWLGHLTSTKRLKRGVSFNGVVESGASTEFSSNPEVAWLSIIYIAFRMSFEPAVTISRLGVVRWEALLQDVV